jgi:hypothetical protein
MILISTKHYKNDHECPHVSINAVHVNESTPVNLEIQEI